MEKLKDTQKLMHIGKAVRKMFNELCDLGVVGQHETFPKFVERLVLEKHTEAKS